MDEPANLPELVSEFAAITGASPIVGEHYLSACNNDLNRAVEFYFENPPAANQAGPGGSSGAAHVAGNRGADREGSPMVEGGTSGGAAGGLADEDEELQRALAESLAGAEPGGREVAARAGAGMHPAAAGPLHRAVEVLDDDDDDALQDADGMLATMAQLREASQMADREAEARMEETMDRMMAGIRGRPPGTVRTPANYPSVAGVPLPFGGLPGLFPGVPPTGLLPSGFPAVGDVAAARGRNVSGGGAGQSQQRRRVDVGRPDEGGGGGGAAAGMSAAGRGASSWDDDLELPEGMSRHELEEARMMEAAMLGVPYEGRMADFSGRGAAVGAGAYGADADVAPEVLEHRELRWDQDRAYEESLAADRAKEQAAARARAEVDARERAHREAEEAAARAAAAEAARLAALLAAKAARLPLEPSMSASDALTVMVRLPDGSRHSRRFTRTNRLSSLFDFVDVELDAAAKAAAAAAPTPAPAGPGTGAAAPASTSSGAADGSGNQLPVQPSLKPGTYKLVAQFPRRVFSEAESGGKTFEEAGLAGGGGATFFIEQTGG